MALLKHFGWTDSNTIGWKTDQFCFVLKGVYLFLHRYIRKLIILERIYKIIPAVKGEGGLMLSQYAKY